MRSQGSNILPRAPHSGDTHPRGLFHPTCPVQGPCRSIPLEVAGSMGWPGHSAPPGFDLAVPKSPWNSGWKRSPEWPVAHASC